MIIKTDSYKSIHRLDLNLKRMVMMIEIRHLTRVLQTEYRFNMWKAMETNYIDKDLKIIISLAKI